jgi:hypothetical protein
MMRRSRLLVLLTCIACSGCDVVLPNPDDQSSTPDGGSCDAYRQSYCAFGSDCGLFGPSRAECLGDIAKIACLSDRLARDCHDALDTASCVSPPSGCDLVDVADGTDAQQTCERFSDMQCKLDVKCNGIDYDSCRFDLATKLPCDRVVALASDPDPCLQWVQTAGCGEDVDPSCNTLFTVL